MQTTSRKDPNHYELLPSNHHIDKSTLGTFIELVSEAEVVTATQIST